MAVGCGAQCAAPAELQAAGAAVLRWWPSHDEQLRVFQPGAGRALASETAVLGEASPFP